MREFPGLLDTVIKAAHGSKKKREPVLPDHKPRVRAAR